MLVREKAIGSRCARVRCRLNSHARARVDSGSLATRGAEPATQQRQGGQNRPSSGALEGVCFRASSWIIETAGKTGTRRPPHADTLGKEQRK